MAKVYKAKDLVLNRFVAVKILRDEFTTDDEFIKRFNIEAQAAASITHPNIVSVYDVGKEDNLYYIVMELVKGKTLKEIIVEDGALGWKWSVKVAMQIASALETAHRNNIVHRDIKPHNIIITEEGVAKVTDFGIAKAVSNSTITAFGTTIGSVHYFSPEHARGGYTDAKSDIYSLGVVMYEMITGRVPFDSDTAVSVALKHMQEDPIEPIILKPSIPKSVNDIIMKAMKKDPEERYQNATEIYRDLETSLKNQSGEVSNSLDSREYRTQRVSLNYDKKENETAKRNGKFAKIKKFFEEHPVIKVFTIILICILVFAIAMGGTYLALSLGRAKEVEMPNLVGLTADEAKAKLDELKLVLDKVEEKYDLEIPEGQVISQKPEFQQGFKVNEGYKFTIVISKGPKIVEMPKLVGLTLDEARNTLREADLEMVDKREYSDEIEKDIVIRQETEDGKTIEKGEEIPAGTKVIVIVSDGIEQVDVPDLSGKTESEAKEALKNAKLKWKSTDKISDSSKPNGVVVNQSISSNSVVNKDTEITITVNEFNEIKSGKITINVKSIGGYSKQTDEETGEDLKVYVPLKVTVDGEQVLSETIDTMTTDKSVQIQASGTVVVKVYLDGILKRTESFNLNTQTSITIE